MEFHKPKPVHSWRELLTEIGVVVIGVCIALAAEQTVEWLHWRAQVAEARTAIANELTSNLVGATLRLRSRGCAQRRLDELALVLDHAAKQGSLPPLGDFGIDWRQTWLTGAWDGVVASQTATHFPDGQMVDIASTYQLLARMDEFSRQEVEGWSVLYSMVGPGRRLDPASEAGLRAALGQVRTYSNVLDSMSTLLIERFATLPLSLDGENRKQLAGAQSRPLSDIFICRPIGTPPAAYGQGYVNSITLAPARTEAAIKAMRDIAAAARR
ncbi:MAG: hypothetical protein JO256_03780 [Alphaproteobacteria bacterium]|nr:hypothetical protein [Alphaproteobacteria bacterium]